jgi:hypothetical protein
MREKDPNAGICGQRQGFPKVALFPLKLLSRQRIRPYDIRVPFSAWFKPR